MRHFLYLLTLSALIACQSASEKTAEAIELDENYNYYGENITLVDAKDVMQLAASDFDSDTVDVKISGVINATCPKKGCWMTMQSEEGEVRVTFKDYGFFVPTEGVEGKTTVIEGVAVRTVTDVETLRHYAEDAGKSEEEIAAITEPREEISLIATGVAISK